MQNENRIKIIFWDRHIFEIPRFTELYLIFLINSDKEIFYFLFNKLPKWDPSLSKDKSPSEYKNVNDFLTA